MNVELILFAGPLSDLVLEFSPDQHVFKVNPQCLSKAYNLDCYPIRLRLWVVHILRHLGQDLSIFEEKDTSPQEWYKVPKSRGYINHTPARLVPNRRPYSFFKRDRKDPSLLGTHYQGAVAAFYSPCLPLRL